MDFADAPDEAAFRGRLRDWLADNNPKLGASSTTDEYWEAQPEWHRALYRGGWFGLSWPEEYGVMKLETVPNGFVAQHLMPFQRGREYDDFVN